MYVPFHHDYALLGYQAGELSQALDEELPMIAVQMMSMVVVSITLALAKFRQLTTLLSPKNASTLFAKLSTHVCLKVLESSGSAVGLIAGLQSSDM
jgi:hypothetical protein